MKIKPSPKIPCHCQDCTGMLFHLVPEGTKKKKTKTKVATYSRYSPRTRTLCDDCIRDIHLRGVQRAPLPNAVRWRRSEPEVHPMHLCERHKNERCEREATP